MLKTGSLCGIAASLSMLLVMFEPHFLGATEVETPPTNALPLNDVPAFVPPTFEEGVAEPVQLKRNDSDSQFFGEFINPGESMIDTEAVYEGLDLPPTDSATEGDANNVTSSLLSVTEERKGWRKNIYPRFRIGGFYDDNIFIQETGKESDFIGYVGFGLRVGFGEVVTPLYEVRESRHVPLLYEGPAQSDGNYVLADYIGNYYFFADHSDQNAYDQDALFRAGWTGGKLALGFDGRFQSLSTPDIDAGGRVRRYILYTAVNGNYALSDKSSLETNFSYTGTQYVDLIDSNDFYNENWFNIQIAPKLKIAPGVGVGVLSVQGSPNQPYGRVLIRAIYEYSEKLSFKGRIGLEYRDVEEGSAFRNSPVFGLGVSYVPWDSTTLSLETFRYAEASALLAGADYTITGVELRIRQRFLQRFYATLTGGYQNLDYYPVANDSQVKRNDNYFFVRAAVAFDITKWCNAEIFYSHERDSSSRPGNSFTVNQVGIGFDFAF